MSDNIETDGEILWKNLWGRQEALLVLEDIAEHPELPSIRRKAWISHVVQCCSRLFLDTCNPPEGIFFRDDYAEATHWMVKHLTSQAEYNMHIQRYPEENPFLGPLRKLSNPDRLRGYVFHGHPGIGLPSHGVPVCGRCILLSYRQRFPIGCTQRHVREVQCPIQCRSDDLVFGRFQSRYPILSRLPVVARPFCGFRLIYASPHVPLG
ncbi:uncharacterized protein BT62DRAFT_359184 [Guyanagaster necrorhizus]|uniref:Uncharacterized protein n=1 Tax=Guyanagaster necrorhizus TaxID=856835 RepID=A0A9P7VLC8_9AGAR|nr:uncharacterized protein BT62DRAFT_359184 [Guyanagaster necrorhizus MCA 3950]KAG7442824.1 hypothetical protein BT62DRAFT_359184 [Guyanagaster necrorhizus MCA 3950]